MPTEAPVAPAKLEKQRKSVSHPESDSLNMSPAERQMVKHNGPAPIFRDYRVSKIHPKDGLVERVVSARDEGEAWAVFCDLLQHWPSRQQVDATVAAV